MNFFKTTKQHSEYWKNRKIDWLKHYGATWNHPHRQMIVDKLRTLRWISIVEVGCACGPNLARILAHFPRADVGGVDINADAIKAAEGLFGNVLKGSGRSAWFKVNSGDKIMISDGATDVVLSDMSLIYVGPTEIKKYLLEMKRITRNHIILMEFHHKSFWKRLWLKWKSGYNAYDYKKLLKECGFFNIKAEKLPPELWDNHDPQKTYAYLVTAQK